MKDIVLVPTFARPEYLALCLEYLAKADGGAEKHVWVSHDRHVNDQKYVEKESALSAQIVGRFKGRFAELTFSENKPHPYIGNPCNFLELYKRALLTMDARYVYLVEDDVIVNQDFFRWHEAVQARGDYFCTVGWHCVRWDGALRNDNPLQYIETQMDYSSIGVCWKREKLGPLCQHARPEYYRNMGGYIRTAFPTNPVPWGQWTEQAGIITRLLHDTKNRWVAWPTRRRCSHVGVSGYHRPNGHRFAGELDDRIKQLRAAISTDTIVGMNKDFGGDIEPLLTSPDWKPEQLTVAQRLPYNGRI